jgi:hypothetical protein
MFLKYSKTAIKSALIDAPIKLKNPVSVAMSTPFSRDCNWIIPKLQAFVNQKLNKV